MDSKKARAIVIKSQKLFIEENLPKVIEIINKRIELEASGSKQYKTSMVHVDLCKELSIVEGALITPVKNHYASKGFNIEYNMISGRDESYLTISWKD